MRILSFALAAMVGVTSLGLAQVIAPRRPCAGPTRTVEIDSIEFTVDSLPGWAVACPEDPRQGLLVFTHEADRRQFGPITLVYIRLRPGQSLDSTITEDLARRKTDSPQATSIAVGRIRTKSGDDASIREIRGVRIGRGWPYQLLAYVPRGRYVILFLYGAYSELALNEGRRDVERLVKSYASTSAAKP